MPIQTRQRTQSSYRRKTAQNAVRHAIQFANVPERNKWALSMALGVKNINAKEFQIERLIKLLLLLIFANFFSNHYFRLENRIMDYITTLLDERFGKLLKQSRIEEKEHMQQEIMKTLKKGLNNASNFNKSVIFEVAGEFADLCYQIMHSRKGFKRIIVSLPISKVLLLSNFHLWNKWISEYLRHLDKSNYPNMVFEKLDGFPVPDYRLSFRPTQNNQNNQQYQPYQPYQP
jgi:hypothetical protein